MRIRSAVIGFIVAIALFAPASYALQEFTLEEARTRIERLEARVAALEAMKAPGNGGTPEASETHTIRGTVAISSLDFSIEDSDAGKLGAPCWGDAGSVGIRILDEAGDIAASGSLDLSQGLIVDNGVMLVCQFSWTIDVEDSDFYVFEIDGREGPTYSRADLEEAGWTVGLFIEV
jgi:hypothetical protein